MKNKKIPASCLSGGLLSDFGGPKAVVEYRVWYHGDEDDYWKSKTFKGIMKIWESKRKSNPYVEPPLAVVWDKKKEDYREVVIDELKSISDSYGESRDNAKAKGLGSHGAVRKAGMRFIDVNSYVDKWGSKW